MKDNKNLNEEEEIKNSDIENLDKKSEKDYKKEIDLSDQLVEEKDKYIRLFAEFDNFKKRTIKERQDILRFSNQEILESLITVIDDFERAINELEKTKDSDTLEGVKLIYNKFYGILQNKGLSKIEVNIGDDFNIDKHEAITQIEAPDLKNKIVDMIETGYILDDKIIRYAKVVVGK